MALKANTYSVENALIRRNEVLLIDARSESEFAKAHIPGAINIPLLNNYQRKEIGTCYKQNGKQAAVLLGFKLVGPDFYLKAEKALELANGREIIVYCWRGGMRSNISAWIYQMSGLKASVIDGGYKSFRNFALSRFNDKYEFRTLTGYTGSNKTKLLEELESLGERVINLEKMANHRGSVYGGLGKENQPSVEHFENMLAIDLFEKKENILWIESENRAIGKVAVPEGVFLQFQESVKLEIQYPIENRIDHILKEYGNFDKELLIEKTRLLEKRLGNLRMKQAIECILNNDLKGWVKIVLEYYDKSYDYWKEGRGKDNLKLVDARGLNTFQLAVKLKNEYKTNTI